MNTKYQKYIRTELGNMYSFISNEYNTDYINNSIRDLRTLADAGVSCGLLDGDFKNIINNFIQLFSSYKRKEINLDSFKQQFKELYEMNSI